MNADEKPLSRLVTYAELADLTGLPLGTLYALVHRRAIPHVRLGRRLVRFLAADVEIWLRSHVVTVPG